MVIECEGTFLEKQLCAVLDRLEEIPGYKQAAVAVDVGRLLDRLMSMLGVDVGAIARRYEHQEGRAWNRIAERWIADVTGETNAPELRNALLRAALVGMLTARLKAWAKGETT